MRYFFDDLKNSFDYFLRSHITFSRKNYFEKEDDVNDILANNGLKEFYNLSVLQPSSLRICMENLYFLNVFDKYINKKQAEKISVLDIGSKNWSYVKSEYLYFQSFSKELTLTGIELDAYRLNSRFYTRYEVAKFYTKGLQNIKYISDDLLNHNQKYDYIIWILPFITEYPLLRWGLPLKYFKPEAMLMHANNLLNDDGEMLIINQGEEEYNIQQNLYKKLDLKTTLYGEIEDKYNLFKHKRYCSKIEK